MKLDENQTTPTNNDVVDVDVVRKINTKKIPPTMMSIPFEVNQEFNELLDMMYPDFNEKADNRENAFVQTFRLGIRTQLKLIQQHQQHQCFFEIDGKIPRHDVLSKFACIAYVLENGQNYPFYGEKFLRNTIQSVHNISDTRTIQKYIERILVHATKIPHASGYDITKFCECFPKSMKIEASRLMEFT